MAKKLRLYKHTNYRQVKQMHFLKKMGNEIENIQRSFFLQSDCSITNSLPEKMII
jgi:hypothetical protein